MSNFAREPSTMIPKQSDCRSGELVSRLLAATPPYLYNIPLAPQSFFFSEMLRGFVQARSLTKENNNVIGLPPHPRKGRKRTWKECSTPTKNTEPIELTTVNKSPPPKLPSPILPPPPPLPPSNMVPMTPTSQVSDIPLQPRIQSDLMLPPLWFPPIYPPMPPQFDPLNFLIDLRVAGNLWDGKTPPEATAKDGGDRDKPLNLQTEEKKAEPSFGFPFLKQRHCSAFRVPQPKHNFEPYSTTEKSKSTNYILQNLRTIYKDIKKGEGESEGGSDNCDKCVKEEVEKPETDGKADEETEEEKEKRCKDLRALIGLELVVDYVKKDDKPGAKKPVAEDEEDERDETGTEPDLSDSMDESYSSHSSSSPIDHSIQSSNHC